MHKRLCLHIILIIFSASIGHGQISPGDLSQPHAHLEGMSKCTLCHDLGASVSSTKCLDCHKEINALIDQRRGYHASREVKNKVCIDCHSEHHGRKFDAVRFDQDNFNHNLTSYELEGQHAVIDCRECHKPDNISDPEIRKRDDTFLGMGLECLDCHVDFHQSTLPEDCASCHNIEAFRPAPGFDHDEADFALKGEHVNVECIECHQKTLRNGKEFQEFIGIPFQSCVACHDDEHAGRIKGNCTQCHVETGFDNFRGKGKFNHNTNTLFTLKGKHQQVDCFTCHKTDSDPLTVFSDRDNVSENNCIACHEDQHEGRFGENCAKCHNERSFLSLNNMDFFDHRVTDYPLEGKHLKVNCKECHPKRYSTPIDFSACKNCHEDYHEGEFKKNGISPDCVECHSLHEGFEYSLFTLEEHNETKFPLEGAHMATPCFACHVSEADEKWTFRNLGSECIDCHEDIHKTYISVTYYPNNDCKACHVNDAWSQVNFDHKRTKWPLDGAHTKVSCRECHFEVLADNKTVLQKFNTLKGECISCHENVHGDEFAIDGVTDCKRCHVTESWFPDKFDHSTTRFPLEGRHAEIECKACHEVATADGTTEVIYKLEKLQCIDCHR